MYFEKVGYSYQYIDEKDSYYLYINNNIIKCIKTEITDKQKEYRESIIFILSIQPDKDSYIELGEKISKYEHDRVFQKVLNVFLKTLLQTDNFVQDAYYMQIINNPIFKILMTKYEYNFEAKKNRAENKKYIDYLRDKWIKLLLDEHYKIYLKNGSGYLKEVELELLEISKKNGYFKSTFRNQIAKFYAKQYDIYNALFFILGKKGANVYLLGYFILVTLLVLLQFFYSATESLKLFPIDESLILISLSAFFIFLNHIKFNPFVLLIPRLFFSISLGWVLILSSEEFLKTSIMRDSFSIIAVNIVLIIIVLFYLYTDIRNKLSNIFSNEEVILRSTLITIYALSASFIQGFVLYQLYIFELLYPTTKVAQEYIVIYNNADVLFSLVSIPVLIGIVVQTIWEDRPITEAI